MKNVDIYFLKKLETTDRVYQILSSERITEVSTDSWTDETRIKLLVQFVKNMGVPQQGGDSMYEPDVLTALTLIRDTEMNVFSMNYQMSILKLNGYELMIIERDDLSDAPVEMNTDFEMREMIINNVIYSSLLISAYIGRGYDLRENIDKTTSVDFLSFFNLSSDQLDENFLTSTWNSYQVLKEKNMTNLIDDTKMNDFLTARGYTYIKLLPIV